VSIHKGHILLKFRQEKFGSSNSETDFMASRCLTD